MKTLTNTRKKYCDVVWMNWRRKYRTRGGVVVFGGGGGIISNLFDRGNEVTVSVSTTGTTETDFHLTE